MPNELQIAISWTTLGVDFDYGGKGLTPPTSGPAFQGWDLGGTLCLVQTAPPVDFVEPTIVPRDGGYEVTIRVSSIGAGEFRVHFGPNGDDTDPVCYSGVSGQGERVMMEPGVDFSVIVPPAAIGGPYPFFMERLSGTGIDSFTTDPLVEVVPHLVRSGTLSYRQTLLRSWKTGYRTIEVLEFPQT